MKTALRRWHKWLGWLLVAQLFLWAVTGAVFIFKPGYGPAYERLEISFLPVSQQDIQRVAGIAKPEWQGVRILRSAAGEHLLVNTVDGVKHLDFTGVQRNPSASVVKLLFSDSIAGKAARYGQLTDLTGLTAVTSTGVNLTLDWQQLTLRQQGDDSRLISLLYKLHYLQFTGNAFIDKTMASLALMFLIILSVFGVVVSLSRK